MARDRHGGGEALWRFSLAFYAHPGVAPALIALQDRDGLDVNVVLYAVWLGFVRGHAMDAAELAAAEDTAAPLREALVVELRGLRRRLRGHADRDVQALRRRVQLLEIAAEREVQRRLSGSVIPGPQRASADRLEAAVANLALCLGPAAGSAEAQAVRAALAAFSRRV